MICLTGGERTLDDLARRLTAPPLDLPHLLQEVRLDLLEPLDEQVFPLLGRPDLIVTCRSREEGGGFAGDEAARLTLLERALSRAPGYLDVELSTPAAWRQQLYAARGATRLILSSHRFNVEASQTARARELAASPADLLKIATTVEDAADLLDLLALLPDERRPVLRIGMGPAGILSRALPARFGSPWTYVVPEGAPATAPGQLTIGQARHWRLATGEPLVPLGLLGGPQVLRSPGPRVYNRVFADRALPYCYLPVVTSRPHRALTLLERLGFAGASVTMPLKESLLPHLHALHPPADQLGAVNTVKREGRHWLAWNTDAGAIRALLAGTAGQPALVLGAGGSARAAVFALRALDCPVEISARDPERAAALARALGGTPLPWEQRTRADFTVLINATPCGSDGRSSPMAGCDSWQGRLVLDLVLAGEQTPLLREARTGGARVLSGWQMWVAQGVRQMEALIGQRFTAEELEAAVRCSWRWIM